MNEQDAHQILDRLELLDHYETTLRELAETPLEEIASDQVKTAALERILHVAAQLCIDVGNYLASENGWRSPKSYADVFQVLGEEGVLSEPLAERMSELARLRNILVHMYLDVDMPRLHASLKTGVEDFSQFSREVIRFMESHEKAE